MTQENILKLLSGASKVARNTSKMMENKGGDIIEEKILKGKYVTREEYNALKRVVEDIRSELQSLKK